MPMAKNRLTSCRANPKCARGLVVVAGLFFFSQDPPSNPQKESLLGKKFCCLVKSDPKGSSPLSNHHHHHHHCHYRMHESPSRLGSLISNVEYACLYVQASDMLHLRHILHTQGSLHNISLHIMEVEDGRKAFLPLQITAATSVDT